MEIVRCIVCESGIAFDVWVEILRHSDTTSVLVDFVTKICSCGNFEKQLNLRALATSTPTSSEELRKEINLLLGSGLMHNETNQMVQKIILLLQDMIEPSNEEIKFRRISKFFELLSEAKVRAAEAAFQAREAALKAQNDLLQNELTGLRKALVEVIRKKNRSSDILNLTGQKK